MPFCMLRSTVTHLQIGHLTYFLSLFCFPYKVSALEIVMMGQTTLGNGYTRATRKKGYYRPSLRARFREFGRGRG